MTIHRHCRAGRITSRLSDDGQRLIDLSELIRAYGEAPNLVTPDTTSKASQRYTLEDTQKSMRNDLLLREIQALREQVTQLQDEVRELRQLPSPRQLEPDLEPAENRQIKGFDDILRRFEKRH
ncbi:hypothetical protein QC823_15565 [Halomonas vilamensis]|uniref:Uncharacterized protein n=1 Tax=Vreelandella vilamensis TaxID=531309 RepID=A0ABU1H7U8_9GAMM|nr:hypothetical protein [Halomonas vilamensis]MDR5900383.1 hypothetical protein [Halomonas vilamensis]